MLCVLNFMDIHTYTQNVSIYFKYFGTFSTLGALQNTINIPIDVHMIITVCYLVTFIY